MRRNADRKNRACAVAAAVIAIFGGLLASAAAEADEYIIERIPAPLIADDPAPDAEYLADGTLIVSDGWHVHEVNGDGTFTTLAGVQSTDDPDWGDGGPAEQAYLGSASAVAPLPGGGYLIATNNGYGTVRKVDAAGIITTVAGGADQHGAEGGQASAFPLGRISDLAVLPGGGYLIADRDAHRVYEVATDGTIHTVAGGGAGNGDSGQATDAALGGQLGLGALSGGGFLIADADADVVRKVAAGGAISRVAGTGTEGTDTEGPATEVDLGSPTDVVADPDGGFVITTDKGSALGSGLISRVDPSGMLTNLAGGHPYGICNGALAVNATVRAGHITANPSGGYTMQDRSAVSIRNLRLGTPSVTVNNPGPITSSADDTGGIVGVGDSVGMSATGKQCAPTHYVWDLDGDGTFETDGAGVDDSWVSPTYATRGVRTVTVRAIVDGWGQAEASKTLTVGPLGISINDGAVYTNDRHVTVRAVYPPTAATALLSNDGGFGDAETQPVATDLPWKLTSTGADRLPKTVYVRFPDVDDTTYTDDIVLDRTDPVVRSAVIGDGHASRVAARRGKAKRIVTIKARDGNSGVADMQVTTKKSRREWVPFDRRVEVGTKAGKVFVRVRDRAGNASRWKTARR